MPNKICIFLRFLTGTVRNQNCKVLKNYNVELKSHHKSPLLFLFSKATEGKNYWRAKYHCCLYIQSASTLTFTFICMYSSVRVKDSVFSRTVASSPDRTSIWQSFVNSFYGSWTCCPLPSWVGLAGRRSFGHRRRRRRLLAADTPWTETRRKNWAEEEEPGLGSQGHQPSKKKISVGRKEREASILWALQPPHLSWRQT